MPQNGPLETGYWNPAIVTDEKGEASITITMPDQSTAWELAAKGISAETLAGEAKTDLTVKKDLFGELKLPAAFTDGDDAQIQATVHNSLVEKGQIQVTLKTTIGDKTVEEKRTIDVDRERHQRTVVPRGDPQLDSGLKPEKKDDGGNRTPKAENARQADSNEAVIRTDGHLRQGDRRDPPRRADSSIWDAGLCDGRRQRFGRYDGVGRAAGADAARRAVARNPRRPDDRAEPARRAVRPRAALASSRACGSPRASTRRRAI